MRGDAELIVLTTSRPVLTVNATAKTTCLTYLGLLRRVYFLRRERRMSASAMLVMISRRSQMGYQVDIGGRMQRGGADSLSSVALKHPDARCDV